MMKKPYQIMSTAALITAVAATGMQPVQVADADETLTEYSGIVFNIEGESVNISPADYEDAILGNNPSLAAQLLDESGALTKIPQYIKVGTDYYQISDFEDVVGSSDRFDEAINTLAASGSYEPIDESEASDISQYTEISVESVKAETPASINVRFSDEIESFTEEDVTIESDNGSISVSSVGLSEDNKSAALTLNSELTDGTAYNINIQADTEYSATLDYQQGEIAEIQVADQVIPPDTPTAIDYTVLTNTGVDVTETTDAQVTFGADNGTINEEGELELGNGESALVGIGVEGTDISNNLKVWANESEPETLAAYTVTDENPDWENEDFETVHQVKMGEDASLHTRFLDQYGEPASADNVTYETLASDILIVDEETGALIPEKEGTAEVKVTNEGVTETVTIEVLKAPQFSGLSIEQDGESIENLSVNPAAGENSFTVNTQLLDQYEDDFSGDEDLTVEVDGSSVVLDGSSDISVSGSKEIDFNIVDGVYGVSTVTISNQDGSISETFEVNVQEAGEYRDYTIEGAEDLDLNTESGNAASTVLQVYKVDENGLKTSSNPSEANWTISDQQGDTINTMSGVEELHVSTDGTGDVNLSNKGIYTFKAEIGTYSDGTETIEVINTAEPPEVSASSNELTVQSDADLFDELTDLLEVTQDGETVEDIGSLEVASQNNRIINDGGSSSIDELSSGDDVIQPVINEDTVMVTVQSITMDDDTTVDTNLDFDVTVESIVDDVAVDDNNSDKINISFTEDITESGSGVVEDQFNVTLGGETFDPVTGTPSNEEFSAAHDDASTVSVYVYGYENSSETLNIDYTSDNYFTDQTGNALAPFSATIESDGATTVEVYKD